MATVMTAKIRYRNEAVLIDQPDRRIQPVNVDTAGPHDQVHISLSNQDSVLWYSDRQPFRVVSITNKETQIPDNPFSLSIPTEYSKSLSSGSADKNSLGKVFKVKFEFKNRDILDPEVAVDA